MNVKSFSFRLMQTLFVLLVGMVGAQAAAPLLNIDFSETVSEDVRYDPLGLTSGLYADAGENQVVLASLISASLDGSGSLDPDGSPITYEWSQIYGPTTVIYDNINDATPEITNLTEGVYLFNLRVSNGSYFDNDEVQIIISSESNVAPNITLTSPQDGANFLEGESVLLSAAASRNRPSNHSGRRRRSSMTRVPLASASL